MQKYSKPFSSLIIHWNKTSHKTPKQMRPKCLRCTQPHFLFDAGIINLIVTSHLDTVFSQEVYLKWTKLSSVEVKQKRKLLQVTSVLSEFTMHTDWYNIFIFAVYQNNWPLFQLNIASICYIISINKKTFHKIKHDNKCDV